MTDLISIMLKYAAYKDSGVEWIGEIPEEWKIESLKTLLAERKEKNDPVKTDNILSLTMDRGVIPYAEKGAAGNKAKEDLTAYKLAYPGDIVINSMNVIAGSVGLSKYFGAVSPVYYMLYPRDKEDVISYFNATFQNEAFQKSLIGLGNGILIKKSESSGKLNTIRMRIPMSRLNRVRIPYPKPSQQTAIANFLNCKTEKIDQAIAIKEKQIQLLKERKQILIQTAVTKGLDPNVPMHDSGVKWIGEIPKHWGVKRLRLIGTTQNGISAGAEYFGSGYPFVSYGDVYNNRELPHIVKGLAESSIRDRIQYSVKQGDVFFTRTSETVEEIGFSSVCIETIENSTFAGFLIRFRPKPGFLEPEYSKYYFCAHIHRAYFVGDMNLVIRASLSQELLKNLPVLLPPKEEQITIYNHIQTQSDKIDKAIAIQQKMIERLKEYKATLINSAVTGKIKVPQTGEAKAVA